MTIILNCVYFFVNLFQDKTVFCSPYAMPLPASLNQFQAMMMAKRRTMYQVKYFLVLLVSCVMP